MERWKKALVTLSIVGLLAALSGCGSGGGESAPLSKVKFKASGNSVFSIVDREGVHFDVDAYTIGSGGTNTFVQSAYDSASMECDFYLISPVSTNEYDYDFDSYLETDNKYEVKSGGNTLYEVVIINGANGYHDGASCKSNNACIECSVTSGTNCSISCTGNVPSNKATNNTQFYIAYKGVGYLRTGYPIMADEYVTGEVFGFHAKVDGWDEFQLTDTYSDFEVCTDDNILDGLTELNTYFTQADRIGNVDNFSPVNAYQEKFFFIRPQSGWLLAAAAAGDVYNNGEIDQYECPVELTTVIPMTIRTMNGETPGYYNDLGRGNITIGIGICDDYANPSCDLYNTLANFRFF
jgi:hypothetical protein